MQAGSYGEGAIADVNTVRTAREKGQGIIPRLIGIRGIVRPTNHLYATADNHSTQTGVFDIVRDAGQAGRLPVLFACSVTDQRTEHVAGNALQGFIDC